MRELGINKTKIPRFKKSAVEQRPVGL